MKKILLSLFLCCAAINVSANQDPIQCPYPTVVASIGLNQVDRASMGVFVYGQNNYDTPQSWMFETGILPSSLSDPQAIAAANADIVSMGTLGPIKDQGGNGELCLYYSYMTQLFAVAATGFSAKNLEPLIIHHTHN